MITLVEAVRRANELVSENTGIECDPDLVRRVERNGSKCWWIVYDSSHFFNGQIEEGAVIDGGEYIIKVDCRSGDATVVG